LLEFDSFLSVIVHPNLFGVTVESNF
jgi:hypothetical protein